VSKKSETQLAWDRHSKQYQALHKIPTKYIHYGPYCPTEDDLQLIGDVRGKRVIELGCGGGQCSVAFAKQGAIVTGVDFSEKQLSHARELAASEGIEVQFNKADITELSTIPDNSQDVAFSAYSFQYVEKLREGFNEVYRILKSGGLFVFSLNHPFYWCFPDDRSELKIVRSYFDEKSSLGDLGRDYPRNFAHLFNTLFDTGFIVARIVEPEPKVGEGDVDVWP
jgi:ubiquinone/menaquinone biosynthesis C-methylase UbiE